MSQKVNNLGALEVVAQVKVESLRLQISLIVTAIYCLVAPRARRSIPSEADQEARDKTFCGRYNPQYGTEIENEKRTRALQKKESHCRSPIRLDQICTWLRFFPSSLEVEGRGRVLPRLLCRESQENGKADALANSLGQLSVLLIYRREAAA